MTRGSGNYRRVFASAVVAVGIVGCCCWVSWWNQVGWAGWAGGQAGGRAQSLIESVYVARKISITLDQ